MSLFRNSRGIEIQDKKLWWTIGKSEKGRLTSLWKEIKEGYSEHKCIGEEQEFKIVVISHRLKWWAVCYYWGTWKPSSFLLLMSAERNAVCMRTLPSWPPICILNQISLIGFHISPLIKMFLRKHHWSSIRSLILIEMFFLYLCQLVLGRTFPRSHVPYGGGGWVIGRKWKPWMPHMSNRANTRRDSQAFPMHKFTSY